jgi:hypothetical protein
MSSIKVSGNASGTGAFTVTSPNSNNTQTLTLPDATDTLVGAAATQTLTNKTLTTPTVAAVKSAASGTPTAFQDSGGTEVGTLCRAWVSFNGTGSTGTNQTIRASFNVSSVLKNATGDYTVTFSNALTDANYCVTACARNDGVGSGANYAVVVKAGTTPTSSAITIVTGPPSSGALNDSAYIYIAIFR